MIILLSVLCRAIKSVWILVAHSRFFSVKLSDRWTQQQQRTALPYLVKIADCDDVEVYVETLRLMYYKDLRKKLMKEDVSKVLGILKVSAAIGFDAGILSCLEYLEAAPWAEDEEDKVASLLSELRLESVGAGEIGENITEGAPDMHEAIDCYREVTKGMYGDLGKVMEGYNQWPQNPPKFRVLMEEYISLCKGMLFPILFIFSVV
ncbi:hypothetical protein P8452_21356 [Trifolium repens]|nr:hypothetical protein P8452_21356 [Trifolium repens]